MTVRAIVGLAVLNGLLAVEGLALLYAVRGFRSWGSVGRLAGLGYLLGVAAHGIVWTQLLVLGVPFGAVGILLSIGGVTAVGITVGRIREHGIPPTPSLPVLSLGSLVTAGGIALLVVFLEALFRAARLEGLYAFDAWAFWIPKAQAVYFTGGLDEQVFTTVAGPTYPPLLPILDATAFHAMGGVDTITLHLQFWFLVVGAAAALAGILHRHALRWLLWPSLLLVLVVPRFSGRLLAPQADVLVDVLFVTATLLVALWLRDGRGWRLAAVAILLGGAVLTKREGLLFAGCVLVVGLAASVVRGRASWPAVLGVAIFVGVTAVPWRLWYSRRGIGGEAPLGADDSSLKRLVDALSLSLEVAADVGRWSVVPIVGAIAVAASLVVGDRMLTAFVGAVALLVLLGGAGITFALPDLALTDDESLNPIVRYTGALTLLLGTATPLMLTSVWRGETSKQS